MFFLWFKFDVNNFNQTWKMADFFLEKELVYYADFVTLKVYVFTFEASLFLCHTPTNFCPIVIHSSFTAWLHVNIPVKRLANLRKVLCQNPCCCTIHVVTTISSVFISLLKDLLFPFLGRHLIVDLLHLTSQQRLARVELSYPSLVFL